MVYKIILKVYLITLSFGLYGQQDLTIISKSDGRFIGNIKSNNVSDPVGLMDRFDLHLQWWSLMSEPVEYYDFTWFSTGRYTVEVKGQQRTMTKATLSKYPDLARRFERITPIDIKIEISGVADAGTLDVKRGRVPNTGGLNTRARSNYKKDGQSYDRYQLWGDIIYEIPDANLVPSYSAKKGSGIVPGSQHWNEFLFWPEESKHLNRIKTYEKGNKNDKTLLEENKNRFSKTNSFSLSARILEVEWPLPEMRNIIEKYDAYEKGIEKPSEAKSKANTLNDLLSDVSDRPVTKFEISRREKKVGVVAEDGRILIPFKEWNITEYDPKTGFAKVEKNLDVRTRNGSCDKVFRAQIVEVSTVDSSGESILPPRKIAVTFYGYNSNGGDTSTIPLVLTTYPNETLEEKRARERRQAEARKKEAAERKRCNALNEPIFDAFKKELQAQGIDTSRLG
ncbi:MAG: hypothetical protein JJ978_12775 [Roseivirga sp.]|uniref:hypothetical protein n=1 Tax=Roseivirga sp. TaxID=1964215 RepID=UPI001B2C5853|nr:hypothetical protein [Roseivirga sp.]MBO6496437.1 hypothetical protein [Roseivirga sp.]